jgi:hypothetical protein
MRIFGRMFVKGSLEGKKILEGILARILTSLDETILFFR